MIDRCPPPVFLPLELFFISCSWHSAGQPGAPVSALLHLLLSWAAAAGAEARRLTPSFSGAWEGGRVQCPVSPHGAALAQHELLLHCSAC